MEKKYYYVYKWFNSETKEVFYIGKGCRNRYREVSRRNKDFKEYYQNNPCEVEIIEYFDDENEAFKREAELIKFYKEQGQAFANKDAGGKGGCHFVWTPEMREYMSKYNPMKDPKQKERQSKNNVMKKPEIVEKVKRALGRAVIINGIEYYSVAEAAKQLSKAESTIRNWCDKGQDTNGNICGYVDEIKAGIIRKVKIGNKKVIIVDGEYYFNSVTEAAQYIGCVPSSVSRALYKKTTIRGHKCEYANQQPSQGNSNTSTLEGSTTNE